jgi:CubicO group peptidase (beta-lactamase class C family)
MTVAVHGEVAQGFEGVHDAFLENFASRGDVGAGFALYAGGRLVVDLWGGVADPANGRPYTADTVQVVFSTTKGVTAACASLLAQQGALDLDAPVIRYWPEFGQAGKDEIPVRWLLSHRAGVPTIDRRLTFEESLSWDPVVEALAAQAPCWEPGTASGYHGITYGHLVGEVVRRVTGTTMGAYWQDEIAGPLALDFWIGLPDDVEPRVAPMIAAAVPPMSDDARAAYEASLLGRTITLNGAWPELSVAANTRAYRAAELGAAGGVTNARSIARFYAGLIGPVDGVTDRALFTPETIARACEIQSDGEDRVLSMPGVPMHLRFGLGFARTGPSQSYGGPAGFGHGGAGGSAGFADPELGIAGGYAMNQMQLLEDERFGALLAASVAAVTR